MRCIESAVKYIMDTIDEEVLTIATVEKNPKLNKILTLAEKIRTQVIMAIVIKDVEILSSITRKIPLNKCTVSRFVNYTNDYVIEVPSKLVGGKKIIDPVCITYANLNGSVASSGNSVINAMSGLVDAHTAAPSIEVERLELIGDNVIIVTPSETMSDITSGVLECVLTSNSDMGHINVRSHRKFAELCALAMRRYIYKRAYVKLDEGYIKGGHNISRIKEIVDGMSDAKIEYDEALRNWEKIERLNNKKFMSDFISLQISS